MSINALTIHKEKVVDTITSPITVSKPNTVENYVATKAIWDTGATNSVITASLAMSLGLSPITKTTVRGVHGTQEANVYFIHVTLNNKQISLNLLVTECLELSPDDSIGMLIGMDVITQGDFCISNYGGKTTMTFRVPTLEKIDYVAEINENNKMVWKHEVNISHHLPDKCPCGSGKMYKNCHGKSLYNQ